MDRSAKLRTNPPPDAISIVEYIQHLEQVTGLAVTIEWEPAQLTVKPSSSKKKTIEKELTAVLAKCVDNPNFRLGEWAYRAYCCNFKKINEIKQSLEVDGYRVMDLLIKDTNPSEFESDQFESDPDKLKDDRFLRNRLPGDGDDWTVGMAWNHFVERRQFTMLWQLFDPWKPGKGPRSAATWIRGLGGKSGKDPQQLAMKISDFRKKLEPKDYSDPTNSLVTIHGWSGKEVTTLAEVKQGKVRSQADRLYGWVLCDDYMTGNIFPWRTPVNHQKTVMMHQWSKMACRFIKAQKLDVDCEVPESPYDIPSRIDMSRDFGSHENICSQWMHRLRDLGGVTIAQMLLNTPDYSELIKSKSDCRLFLHKIAYDAPQSDIPSDWGEFTDEFIRICEVEIFTQNPPLIQYNQLKGRLLAMQRWLKTNSYPHTNLLRIIRDDDDDIIIGKYKEALKLVLKDHPEVENDKDDRDHATNEDAEKVQDPGQIDFQHPAPMLGDDAHISPTRNNELGSKPLSHKEMKEIGQKVSVGGGQSEKDAGDAMKVLTEFLNQDKMKHLSCTRKLWFSDSLRSVFRNDQLRVGMIEIAFIFQALQETKDTESTEDSWVIDDDEMREGIRLALDDSNSTPYELIRPVEEDNSDISGLTPPRRTHTILSTPGKSERLKLNRPSFIQDLRDIPHIPHKVTHDVEKGSITELCYHPRLSNSLFFLFHSFEVHSVTAAVPGRKSNPMGDFVFGDEPPSAIWIQGKELTVLKSGSKKHGRLVRIAKTAEIFQGQWTGSRDRGERTRLWDMKDPSKHSWLNLVDPTSHRFRLEFLDGIRLLDLVIRLAWAPHEVPLMELPLTVLFWGEEDPKEPMGKTIRFHLKKRQDSTEKGDDLREMLRWDSTLPLDHGINPTHWPEARPLRDSKKVYENDDDRLNLNDNILVLKHENGSLVVEEQKYFRLRPETEQLTFKDDNRKITEGYAPVIDIMSTFESVENTLGRLTDQHKGYLIIQLNEYAVPPTPEKPIKREGPESRKGKNVFYCPYDGCPESHSFTEGALGKTDSRSITEHRRECEKVLDGPLEGIPGSRSNIPVVERTFGLYPSNNEDSVIGVHSLRHLIAITMAAKPKDISNDLVVIERGWAVQACELRACIAHLRNDGADDAGDEQVGGAANDAEGS